jgi:hypothetical protein
MASIALLLWSRLDFTRVDLSNWATTLAFFTVLSFFANISAFMDNAFGPSLGLERAIRRLRRRGHSTPTLLRALVAMTYRGRPLVFLEAVLVMLVVYAALFVGVISAISAATTALRNGLR